MCDCLFFLPAFLLSVLLSFLLAFTPCEAGGAAPVSPTGRKVLCQFAGRREQQFVLPTPGHQREPQW